MSNGQGAPPSDFPGQAPQPQYGTAPPASSGGCGKTLGIGCLVILVLIAIGGVVLYMNARKWIAPYMKTMSDEILKELDLTLDEKDRVREKISAFIDDFENGEVTWPQFGMATQNIVSGPLSAVIFDETVVKPSGLSDDEKAAGSRTLQRVARGLKESKINPEQLSAVNERDSTRQPDEYTDEDVREALTKFKKIADDASIPDEPFVVDIAGEIEAALDKARATTE